MATTVKDLVCGMDIDPATAAGKSEHNGQTYYFCSLGCKKAFDENPEKYLDKEHEHNHEQTSCETLFATYQLQRAVLKRDP